MINNVDHEGLVVQFSSLVSQQIFGFCEGWFFAPHMTKKALVKIELLKEKLESRSYV